MRRGVPPGLTFCRGFTLTELAIVLLIVALLIGGMLVPLSTQTELRRSGETGKLLTEAVEALTGFAASHSASDGKPYLPCPDTDNDGAENRSGNVCTAQEGRLPWTTLGLGHQDAWGNRLRYAVSATYSNSGSGFTLTTAGTLRVCADAACAATLATAVPAVVVSHGTNGAGAYNLAGGTNAAPSNADELANTDGDSDFVLATAAGFDDLVVWLSPNILFTRMIASGRLP